MRVTIISVGKLKEKYLKMAIEEYTKRLRKFCKIELIEVSDEKAPQNMSISQEIIVKNKEGERILGVIKDSMYLIGLAIDGRMLSSEGLAKEIEALAVNGKGHIAFVIGGSLGLSDEILKKCDSLLSFSKMTFPHQLMRVILLEQVYRSFKITHNEPYHK